MISNPERLNVSLRARSRKKRLIELLLISVTGCSVYGPALLSDGNSPLTSGGSSAQAGLDAGDADTSSGGVPSGGGTDAEAAAGAPESSGGGAAAGLGGAAGSVSTPAGAAGVKDSESGAGGEAGDSPGGAGPGNSPSGGTGGTLAAPRDLSTGMKATSSTEETGNETSKGNDGNYASRWCGKDATLPQWWRVDLGALHALTSFSVAFQYADRQYTYSIATSADDVSYAAPLNVANIGAVQTGTFPSGTSARYVKITITKAASVGGVSTWASFYEFTVLGR